MIVVRGEHMDDQGNVLLPYCGIYRAAPAPGDGDERQILPYDSPSRVTLAEPSLDRIRTRAQDLDYWWPWTTRRAR